MARKKDSSREMLLALGLIGGIGALFFFSKKQPPPPPPPCTEGSTRCSADGNSVEQCINGTWVGVTNCAWGCSNGQCNPQPQEASFAIDSMAGI